MTREEDGNRGCMLKRLISGFVSISALIFVSGVGISAFAQARGYLGAIGGISVPSYENTSSRVAFGLVGGTRLDGELGIGAYYLNSAKSEDVAGIQTDIDYGLFGIEGSFHFEGVADGAFVGVRVGTTKLKVGPTLNTSPTHYGVVFGYDKFLNESASLGVEGSWISIESSSYSGNELKGFSALNFMVAAKFWF